ncbi:MAG TPA: AmmeMemoRadiSam system protein B [Acidimicrobiales bacterium]|nr:AmmeMemoRadiSam system protein B [Acidimicrobiales bacterium]
MTSRHLGIRLPAVAGSFYPAKRDALFDSVRQCFAGARRPGPAEPAPKAVVVPHAGYLYSGPVAASAYLRLAPAAPVISRVVLLGPSHRVPLDGVAVSGADAFATPLGVVPVDDAGRRSAEAAGAVRTNEPFALEHSLEVQLPFLQVVLDHFTLVPLAVGLSVPAAVADVLDAVWGGPETVVVTSTDLSHYHPYDVATALDRRTADAVVAMRAEAVGDRDACGVHALRGLLEAARRRDLPVELLDLRNSGDTAGTPDRVVGYGAFAVG